MTVPVISAFILLAFVSKLTVISPSSEPFSSPHSECIPISLEPVSVGGCLIERETLKLGSILVVGPNQDGGAAVYTRDGYSVVVAFDGLHFVHVHVLIVATGKRRSPIEGEALIFTGFGPKGIWATEATILSDEPGFQACYR